MSDSDRTKLIPGNVSNTNLCIYACSNPLSLENGPPTQQRTRKKGEEGGGGTGPLVYQPELYG